MGQSWTRVRNATRNNMLAERAEVASGVWKLMVGLIPYRRLEPGQGMVLPHTLFFAGRGASIHTTFMRFQIDVLFLNRTGRVIGAIHRVRPYRIVWAPGRTHDVVELPAGILEETGCQEGDMVVLEGAVERARTGSRAPDPTPDLPPPGVRR